jgi:transposase-like protein
MDSALISKLPVTLDTRGRVRATKEQQQVVLAEFARSRMSAVQFAKTHGLKYSTFAYWVARQRRSPAPGGKPTLRLLEAVVTPPAGLLVQLPGGARLELCEASQVPLVAALVRALEQSC